MPQDRHESPVHNAILVVLVVAFFIAAIRSTHWSAIGNAFNAMIN